MAVYKLARYVVRPEAREQAERAMHEFASYVRRELADSSWTTYCDPQVPNHFVTIVRADNAAADERHRNAPGTQAFVAALDPLLENKVEFTELQLVTSSDLAPRHRETSRGARRRPR
jgi:quinol monooxygenase YgiN